ncbi:MAG: hypothetical protein ACP5CD_06240, partial [Thermovirgaceae bacterium]
SRSEGKDQTAEGQCNHRLICDIVIAQKGLPNSFLRTSVNKPGPSVTAVRKNCFRNSKDPGDPIGQVRNLVLSFFSFEP